MDVLNRGIEMPARSFSVVFFPLLFSPLTTGTYYPVDLLHPTKAILERLVSFKAEL